MREPKESKGKHTPSHARAPKQEKELASRFGGRTTRGSGCGNEKGDVRVHRVLRIEAKTTKNASFSVTRDMIEKIETAAISHGELPAIIVEFNEGGRKVAEVAVVPTYVLDQLLTENRNG